MKLAFGILCLIAAASAVEISIVYPTALFEDALTYQGNINDMQTEMFELITKLRQDLAKTLKETANFTLYFIEDDVKKVFDIDSPYRTMLFVNNSQTSMCMNNMRIRLNQITEFTGFKSGICLAVYDMGVNKVVNETYNAISAFDDETLGFELSVIAAFAGKNVWTQPETINSTFVNSFNNFKVIYDEFKAKINGFTTNIQEKVAELSVVLNTCYKESQDSLKDQMAIFEVDLRTCITFDNMN